MPVPTSQIGKVLIGLFAGICATFLPRIVTALSTSDPTGKINVFGAVFILLAIVFSGFLGIALMILKWGDPLQPAALFTAALGVPALVAGAFNMSASVNQLQQKTTEAAALASAVRQQTGVRTLQPEALRLPGPQSLLLPDGWLQHLALISPALAADLNAIIQQRSFDAGTVIDERRYLIVLQSFGSLAEARQALEAYKAVAPSATIVEGATSSFIVDGLDGKPESSATIRAVELQQQLSAAGQPGEVSLLPLQQ
jgi:hypothetical protein